MPKKDMSFIHRLAQSQAAKHDNLMRYQAFYKAADEGFKATPAEPYTERSPLQVALIAAAVWLIPLAMILWVAYGH